MPWHKNANPVIDVIQVLRIISTGTISYIAHNDVDNVFEIMMIMMMRAYEQKCGIIKPYKILLNLMLLSY